MRSMFLVLSACTAVANAAECQATEEATLLQLQGVRGQQKKMKAETKHTDAKGLVKTLTHIAHNLHDMDADLVDDALADAADALATLSPAIQQQVAYLQQTILDAVAAVEACHNSAGIEQRAALWTAAEEHSAASVTCEAELEVAIADEASICSADSIADVQSDCACEEAQARREDKEELCAALKTAYEVAYCEHNLQCTTYHECHSSETDVYNQIKADVENEMVPIEQEYVAAEQSTCILAIVQAAMLDPANPPIDFTAVNACQTVDTSDLLVVYPELPGTPEACPAATTGHPICFTSTPWNQFAPDKSKCNNNVGMVYVASQADCKAHAIASGHSYYSFRHNGESQGHKCMSSENCDNGLIGDRTNDWNIYQRPPSCPAGYVQVGELGADISGCGLTSCDERYDIDNELDCAVRCNGRSDCLAFNFAPRGADRNHETETACGIYNSATPNAVWTGTLNSAPAGQIYVQVFCAKN